MTFLKKYLPALLSVLCGINLILYWGDSNTAMAWVVAFAGWSSLALERLK